MAGRWRWKPRIVITVIRDEDGRYIAGDEIWAYGAGRTIRAALRNYIDSVLGFIDDTEHDVGPGLAEQRAQYTAVIAARGTGIRSPQSDRRERPGPRRDAPKAKAGPPKKAKTT